MCVCGGVEWKAKNIHMKFFMAGMAQIYIVLGVFMKMWMFVCFEDYHTKLYYYGNISYNHFMPWIFSKFNLLHLQGI